jgi:hypothetical protein
MTRNHLTFIFLVASIVGYGQNIQPTISPLDTWHSYSIPKDSTTISRYGDDTTSWAIFSANGRTYALNAFHPDARKYIPAYSIPQNLSKKLWEEEQIELTQDKGIMPVNDGYLIAINSGEWGGYLEWYSKDGRRKYKISDDKVFEFKKRGDQIFAIEGINHLGTSKGNLIEIKKINSKWVSAHIIKLPFAPFGICLNLHNNFIIGTSDNIIEVQRNKTYKVIYTQPIWNTYDNTYLYPRSLFIKKNNLYVGMRKGILKLNLKTKEQCWLMRD